MSDLSFPQLLWKKVGKYVEKLLVLWKKCVF